MIILNQASTPMIDHVGNNIHIGQFKSYSCSSNSSDEHNLKIKKLISKSNKVHQKFKRQRLHRPYHKENYFQQPRTPHNTSQFLMNDAQIGLWIEDQDQTNHSMVGLINKDSFIQNNIVYKDQYDSNYHQNLQDLDKLLKIARCEENQSQLLKIIESLGNNIKDQCQKIQELENKLSQQQ